MAAPDTNDTINIKEWRLTLDSSLREWGAKMITDYDDKYDCLKYVYDTIYGHLTYLKQTSLWGSFGVIVREVMLDSGFIVEERPESYMLMSEDQNGYVQTTCKNLWVPKRSLVYVGNKHKRLDMKKQYSFTPYRNFQE